MIGTTRDLLEGHAYRTELGKPFHIVAGLKRGKATTRVKHLGRPGLEPTAEHHVDNGATLQIVGASAMIRIEQEES